MTSTTATDSAVSFPLATAHGGLLKMDTLGRVRTTPERRQAIVDEFERSGVSGAQFAKITGLKYSTFVGWVQQRRRTGAKSSAATAATTPSRRPRRLRWIEAVIDPATAGSTSGQALWLHLPGQVRVELSSPAQVPLVAALMQALQLPAPRC